MRFKLVTKSFGSVGAFRERFTVGIVTASAPNSDRVIRVNVKKTLIISLLVLIT